MEINTLDYSVEELGIDQSKYCFVPAKPYLDKARTNSSFGLSIVAGILLFLSMMFFCCNVFGLPEDETIASGMILFYFALEFIILLIVVRSKYLKPEEADFIQHYGMVRSQYRLFIKDKKLGVCKRSKIILPAEYDKIEIQGVSQIVVWKDNQERALFFPNGFRFSQPRGTSFEKEAESQKERKKDADRMLRNPFYIMLYVVVFLIAFGLFASLLG